MNSVEKSRQKDQSKIQSVHDKLGNVEQAYRDYGAKLVATEKARSEERDKLHQQIQQLQVENACQQDEAKNVRGKMDELEQELQLLSDLFLSLVPAHG